MSTASASTPLAALREVVRTWRRRAWERRSLLELEERDLHDLGMSRGQAIYEANKPFWRR